MKTCRVFMFSLLFLCCTLTTYAQWTNIQNYLTTFDSVGIGVNVPRAMLEVRGTGLISNSGYTVPPFDQEVRAVLQFHSAVNQFTVPPVTDYARNGRIWLDAKSKRFVMASESSDVPISFEIDSSERFRIMPDGIRISRNGSHPTDAYMLIQPDYNVAALNPGATPNAGRITNRYLGHLVFDIRANDQHDAFAIRTDKNMDGNVDQISMVVKPSGRVGMGTSNPNTKVEIREDRDDGYTYTLIRNDGNGGAGLWVSNGSNGSTGSSKVIFRNSNTSNSGPNYWAIGNDRTDANKFKIHPNSDMRGTRAFVFDRSGRMGIGTNDPKGALHILKSGTPLAGLPASENGLLLGSQSTTGYKWIQSYGGMLTLNPRGNGVGIGTTKVPTGFKLAVKGKVICEELKVQLSQSWPDYVFSENYDLTPLQEVEESIRAHGHLPGMPSAHEVEQAGGIAVGEMQRKLLEKVEELTLYMIELKKDNQDLREQVEALKK